MLLYKKLLLMTFGANPRRRHTSRVSLPCSIIFKCVQWMTELNLGRWIKILLKVWLLSKEKFKEECMGGIIIKGNERKRCNKDLMQLFGDLYIVTLSQYVGWIGLVMLIGCIVKASQLFNNNPQGKSTMMMTKKYRWWKCAQTDSNKCKINKTGNVRIT